MQREIDAEGWPIEVHILGVNAVGQESQNATACNGRDIPWLQDTADQNAWGRWRVTWRDVVILDEENVPVAVYNLTGHDLALPANYEQLKTMLRDAAGTPSVTLVDGIQTSDPGAPPFTHALNAVE